MAEASVLVSPRVQPKEAAMRAVSQLETGRPVYLYLVPCLRQECYQPTAIGTDHQQRRTQSHPVQAATSPDPPGPSKPGDPSRPPGQQARLADPAARRSDHHPPVLARGPARMIWTVGAASVNRLWRVAQSPLEGWARTCLAISALGEQSASDLPALRPRLPPPPRVHRGEVPGAH